MEALRQNISPRELTDRNHNLVVSLFEKWRISFDNYTRTESEIHKEFVKKLFLKIEKNGYIFKKETELPYCLKCERFLPDRFVEGKCPHCGYERARGDQCEQCGRLLEPTKLVESRCTICGAKPEVREVIHWYFDMPQFSQQLMSYIENNRQLPDNARNFSLNIIREGLKPRPVTRDNKWGIPAPFKGSEDKTIYVWFDAVLGYISATIEYYKKRGEEEKWREYWFNRETKTLFFIGKDNIPFHTLIFPALLLATHEGYNLPWNVSTNEWLIFEGQKSSKSRRIGIWIDEALKLFPVDYWRYTLIAIRPETRDSNFTWEIFLEKVNGDLNDTLGNFIHRTLTFINSFYGGVIPQPRNLDEHDNSILRKIAATWSNVGAALDGFKLQSALHEIIELSREGNKYLNEKQPWKAMKTDPQTAANVLYVSAQIVKAMSILLEPFIPSTAERLRYLLNIPKEVSWEDAIEPLQVGHKIKESEPLFHKIEASQKELDSMLEKIRSLEKKVPFEQFMSIDMRIGKILRVEKVPKSDNLLKITVDVGEGEPKIAVAGIARYYSPEELIGRQIAVVTNLEPKKVFGIQSEVMILAAEDGEKVAILKPEKDVKPGSRVR